ncbi:hypothetical protein H4R34_004743 [Dimargaris verticillata]|uniref:Uncharacterized protein n=1 Tax=Dimargaris verticillata TaxID=2761393 RepID=A0A9W8AZK4_9FUNG|nr:hypothetical protein H4R34_004743 [Dimargaris verticillata]
MKYKLGIELLAAAVIPHGSALPVDNELIAYESDGKIYVPERESIPPAHLNEAEDNRYFNLLLSDAVHSSAFDGAGVSIDDFEVVEDNAGGALAEVD